MDERTRTTGNRSTVWTVEYQRCRERDQRLSRAARDVARGRLTRALRGYLGLARDAPDDIQQLNRTGDLMVRARQVAHGVDLFLAVARRYERDGFEAKACAIYRKILRLVPRHPEATRRLHALRPQCDRS